MRFLVFSLSLMLISLDSLAGIWSFKNNNKDEVYYYKINNGNVTKIDLPDSDLAHLSEIEPSLGEVAGELPDVYNLESSITPLERVISLSDSDDVLLHENQHMQADWGRVVVFVDLSKFDPHMARLSNQLLLMDGLDCVFYAKDFSNSDVVSDYAESGGSKMRASLIKDLNNNIARRMRVSSYPSFIHLKDDVVNRYSLDENGLIKFKISLSEQKK